MSGFLGSNDSQQVQIDQSITQALDGYQIQINDIVSGAGGVTFTEFNNAQNEQASVNQDVLKALDGYDSNINSITGSSNSFHTDQTQWNQSVLQALDGYAISTNSTIITSLKVEYSNDNTKYTQISHNGIDGYISTSYGDLLLNPSSGNVSPGGNIGFGSNDNKWQDGYFFDLNSEGIVLGINSIVFTDSPYLMRQNDHTLICDCTNGAITIKLPASSGNTGRIYNIKKIDSSGNSVTIAASGTELIDGSNNATISAQYSNRNIQSDGLGNWWIL
jgi:hypothetical protein